MRALMVVILSSLVLSACSVGGTPLPMSTATVGARPATQPAAATLGPTQTTAGAPTAPSTDPFASNFLQLPAPSCAVLTPEQTEGPYFKAGSPERQMLIEENTQGEKLIVAGYVLDQNCQPVPGALLDFWQADASGAYDNSGFNF